MSHWGERTTADRVKLLRAGTFTQEELAYAAGLSPGTVRKLEQGGNLSLASLLRIAVALGTDISVILGQQAPRRGMELAERAALRAISAAVHSSAMGDVGDVEPRSIAHLQKLARAADRSFWQGEYVTLSEQLGQLLPEAAALRESTVGLARDAAAGVLADAYQTSATAANVLGARDLGYAAITHARTVAQAAGDDLRDAHLTATLSWIYLRDGRTKRAVDVADRAARAVEPRYSEVDADKLSVFGQLVTNASVAASRGGASKESARGFLSQAHAVAARLGREHARGLQAQPFGPSYTATQALSVALALGDHGKALNLINTTVLDPDMPLSTRARWRLDIALLRTETKQWDTAREELAAACAMAPAWIRHQALPGVIVGRLADVSVAKIRPIAAAAGVSLGTR
jgi:transcriptional regulator with XRE-family HTH domain